MGPSGLSHRADGPLPFQESAFAVVLLTSDKPALLSVATASTDNSCSASHGTKESQSPRRSAQLLHSGCKPAQDTITRFLLHRTTSAPQTHVCH